MTVSTVHRDVGGTRYEMKLSASATVRISRKSVEWSEDGTRMGIQAIFNSIQMKDGDFDSERLMYIGAEMLENGKGVSLDQALNVFDEMELADVFDWVVEACQASAPQDAGETKGSQPGKPKAAKKRRSNTSTA